MADSSSLIRSTSTGELRAVRVPISMGVGARYVAWVRRRHRAVLVGAAVVIVLSGLAASRLELRTSLSELLPTGDPGVAALSEVERRFGQLSAILGYGLLLPSHNQALVTFGALAILGEFACLCTALLVMPAILALRDRGRERVNMTA